MGTYTAHYGNFSTLNLFFKFLFLVFKKKLKPMTREQNGEVSIDLAMLDSALSRFKLKMNQFIYSLKLFCKTCKKPATAKTHTDIHATTMYLNLYCNKCSVVSSSKPVGHFIKLMNSLCPALLPACRRFCKGWWETIKGCKS